ncbi:MAG: GDSL-type esterase/lipase family protein [Kiritimatiellia bacterium]
MSKWLNFLAGLVAFSVFASTTGESVAENQRERTRVACVGDSITYGLGIQNRAENCYPAQLGHMLGKKWLAGNFGVSGATLLEKGPKPYRDLKAFDMALKFQPDVVVIMLGTNDTSPLVWPEHKEDFVPDYVKLVKSFQELESKPAVWICYPAPIYPGEWGPRDRIIKDEIIPRIDMIAEETGARIIDLYSPMKDRREFFPDTVHPNAAGAKRIAEIVADVISSESHEKAGTGQGGK